MSVLDAVEPSLSVDDPAFKEDAVREEIVFPLLVRLGYVSSGDSLIIRSKNLSHPFVRIGTTPKPVHIIPDYLLSVDGRHAWVLDAKSPRENIVSGSNVEQAYSYAIHPEIRVNYFALCNGREFSLFEITSQEPLLNFKIDKIENSWQIIHDFLNPNAFRAAIIRQPPKKSQKHVENYLSILPPREMTGLSKQSARRHHGVHGYFTRQVWSVVQNYIETFTKKGDVVLDPFGGTGVTLIESLVLERKSIQVDINPLSKFIVETLISPIDPAALVTAFDEILASFEKQRPKTSEQIEKTLRRHPYPKNVKLPENSESVRNHFVF